MSRSASPPPVDDAAVKRKRSTSQASGTPPPSTRRRHSPSPPRLFDRISVAVPRVPGDGHTREHQLDAKLAEQEAAGVIPKPKLDFKAEMQKMALTRGGGVYIPPARLRAMQAEMNYDDPNTPEFQRVRWDALRKSINGLINKVNVGNIKHIIPELFQENLIRGRGLLCRSVMKAQSSSLPFTPVFAALISIINTKLPIVGELLIHRLISQFRRAYKRNDKPTSIASSTFLAQLVNQQVVEKTVALEIIILLLEKVTDDSVEIAVGFVKEVGAFLSEAAPKANEGIYERFRAILTQSEVGKRSQYMIEVLIQIRRDKFKDNPTVPEGLDLVEDDDVITHDIGLQDDITVQETLNVFKFDGEWTQNEEKYEARKNEILGVDSDSDGGTSGESGSESDDEQEDEVDTGIVDGQLKIHDHTGANLINFRRSVYLTIMSSLDFEEAAHKLLKGNIEEGLEIELANMVIECCSQERTYTKFYGLLGERFCKVNQGWAMTFEQSFRNYYDTIHRYETNRLRNIARFFGHLLAQDGIPWGVFEVMKMNEEDTTSSSRIFVKILFQELSESLGLKVLAARFKEKSGLGWFAGMFPLDNPKNTRFSINYFTSIGLGALTEDMREHLKNAPALLAAQRQQIDAAQVSSSDSSSEVSSTSSSESDSSSDVSSDSSDRRDRRPTSPRRRRARSYNSSSSSEEDSRNRRRRRSSRSPPPPHASNGRRRSPSYEVTAPPRRSAPRGRRRSDSVSSDDNKRFVKRSNGSNRNDLQRRRSRPNSHGSRSPPPPPSSHRRDDRNGASRTKREDEDVKVSSPPRRYRDRRQSPSPRRLHRGRDDDDSAKEDYKDEVNHHGRRRRSVDRSDRRRDDNRSKDVNHDQEPKKMQMNPARAAMMSRR